MNSDEKIAAALEVAEPEPPCRRADAVPYISHKSLLCTARAVRHERVELRHGGRKQVAHDLVLAFAGDRDDLSHFNMGERKKRVRYANGKTAKEGMHIQVQNLRRAKSDVEFNKIQLSFLQAIRDAQLNVTYQHVHDCVRKVEECGDCDGLGKFVYDDPQGLFEADCATCSSSGHPPCTFDWSGHRLEREDPSCDCSPVIGEMQRQTGDEIVRMVTHNGEEN